MYVLQPFISQLCMNELQPCINHVMGAALWQGTALQISSIGARQSWTHCCWPQR